MIAYPANIYLFKVTMETLEKSVNMFTKTTSVTFTYFTPFSGVSIVDIKQINVSLVLILYNETEYFSY